MTDFYFYGRRVATIFQALPSLGKYEDDMSRSIAWVMSQCPEFLSAFLKRFAGCKVDPKTAVIRCQVIDKSAGRTDVEIQASESLHLIIEAKRGWELPGQPQLNKYANRLCASDAKRKLIVVLTDCSHSYSRTHLSSTEIAGIKIKPVSWGELAQLASDIRGKCASGHRYLIGELLEYLRRIITVQQIDSNWVYVLALAKGTPNDWGISWIDIVNKRHRYFHPVGLRGWPPDPPNYIAFRYRGELQSIHRIEGHVVVTDLHEVFREIPSGNTNEPLYVYKLGKPFRPDHPVPTGSNIKWASRRWCMLDTLFTSPSISEAYRISKEREQSAPEFAPR
jgi:hypothetical protein